MDLSDDALARLFVPKHLIAELTSRCNLRCRYCQKASDAWNATPGRDEDASDTVIGRLFAALPHLHFKTVQLSGIGEFTFRKDWVKTLERFHQHGLAVTLISNFARPLSEEELDALLNLDHLMVSIDTMDAEMLKSARRSVSLATIVTNLVRLRMQAKKRGVRLPYIKLNAVLYVENLRGIEDLAYFAVEASVNEMQYERMEPNIDPTIKLPTPGDIRTAPPNIAAEALQQIDRSRSYMAANRVSAMFHGDLIQILQERAAA